MGLFAALRGARLLGWLLALLCVAAPGPAAAQGACLFHHRISFADGSAGCLTDYAELAQHRVRGLQGTVADLVPRHGTLAVAATVGDASCPVQVGVSRLVGSFTPTYADRQYAAAREQQALESCEAGAGWAPGCTCKLILSDGKVLLDRAELKDRFGSGRVALASAAPAPAPSPPAAPVTAPAAASPTAKPAPAAAAPSDDLVKLRQELEELRRRMQGAGAAPVDGAAASASVPAVKVRALVVGNGAYQSFGRLPNPRNDAQAIAEKFRSMGIAVDLVLDADRDAFVRALNQYTAKASGSDVNIFYYAGHGVQVEGVNYLVPTNMSADGVSAGYIKLNGISLNAALDYLPAKTRLVFLDACRDNPVSRNLNRTRSVGAAGLAPVSTATGTLIAHATKDGATAEDGDGRHSPYTTALLEHLGKPQDIAVVLRHVRQTVMQLTSNRQEPWEYGSLIGDQLILARIAR